MNILTHDEAKRLSQSSTDPLEVIRNVEAAVIIKLAGSQVALKDEIRLIWQPKCDALRQQLEAAHMEGHAAALAELRAGGVELTSEMIFWLTDNPNSGDIRDALQDYGDRRVAAAVMTTPKEQTP